MTWLLEMVAYVGPRMCRPTLSDPILTVRALLRTATCSFWRQCAGGSEVIECVHPGGHEMQSWFPRALWTFMGRHSLEGRVPLGPPGPPFFPTLRDNPSASNGLGAVAIVSTTVAAALVALAAVGLVRAARDDKLRRWVKRLRSVTPRWVSDAPQAEFPVSVSRELGACRSDAIA